MMSLLRYDPTEFSKPNMASMAETPLPWFVVQTHIRQEAAACRNIQRLKIESYMPMLLKDCRAAKHRDKLVPLFPRYIFVRLDLERDRWRHICWCQGVWRLISHTSETPTPVPPGQVERIMRMGREKDGVIDLRETLPVIPANTRVKVIDGLFEGWEGVCHLSDSQRVVVLLKLLGADRPVPLQRNQIEIIE